MKRERRVGHVVLVALGFIVAGCAAAAPTGSAAPEPSATPMPSSAPAASSAPSIQDVMALEFFSPLEPGAYFIDPDGDRSTPMRVVYDIPAEGWAQWIGAAKFSDVGHTGVSITAVSNLVTDGCHDHDWADPPVGPSVDELAAALADLAPFEMTSAARDVTMAGFPGKYLEWSVPDLPVQRLGDDWSFTGCTGGMLKSWVAFIDAGEPGDAFYGYTNPGYREEFWILDVAGTRLMIAAGQSPGSPAQDVAERDAILDSIVIDPT